MKSIKFFVVTITARPNTRAAAFIAFGATAEWLMGGHKFLEEVLLRDQPPIAANAIGGTGRWRCGRKVGSEPK